MMAQMKMTVGRKIYAIIALCFVGFLGVTAFEISEFGAGLESQKRLELKHLTDLALDVAKEEHAAVQKGAVSEAQARQRAAARIKAMRYGNNDYFWINDMHPRMVMHPTNPALDGQDLTDNKDPNGMRLFVAFIDVVKREGRGYVAYEWPKPGAERPQPKLSYVTGFAPWGWVIGTGVYIDDLKAQTWAAARTALIITAFVLLFAGAVSVVVARRMAKAMAGMTAAMGELASGRFDVVLPGLGRGDEIGDIAAAVETFKVKAVEKARMESDEREARAHAAAEEKRRSEEHDAAQRKAAAEKVDAERKATMLALADQFEGAVGDIINTVSSASTELEAAARTLTEAADTTQRLSGSVAAASEEASSNVASVACATEELTASVGEISRQVHESSEISNEAVRQAEKTDARISDLSQAAGRIGDVVKLISAVAEQTNLLALNATIEAARAGEAGRGFAVVAHEVKALAAQTAKATEEISTQIAGMQAATRESVDAIKEISTTIGRISDISAAVSSAVEEQGAATQEIAHNVQQAAVGTADVAANITDVNRGAGETGAASTQVLASAQSLAKESIMLKTEVARFLATVRAA